MTTPCISATVPLYRPWWERAANDLAQRLASIFKTPFTSRKQRAAALDQALYELDGLSPQLLEDIGAPEWVQERGRHGRWSAIDPSYWRG